MSLLSIKEKKSTSIGKPDLDLHEIIKVHYTTTDANTGPEGKETRFKTGENLALIKYYEWPKNYSLVVDSFCFLLQIYY